MKVRYYVAFVAAAAIAVVLITTNLVARTQGDAEVGSIGDVPHFRMADIRVRITEEPQISRNQDPVYVQLESGVIPAGVTHLQVLTDENCQPDADGVSHRLNRVQFETEDGTGQAALRHHHRMWEEPCLTPGQTLELVG